MRRTMLAAAVCSLGLAAGCGSSSQTPTTPASAGSTNASTTGRGALTHTGRVGTVSPASGKLNATNPTVLKQIESRLVGYYTSKGFSGITAICSGTSPTTASCRVTGTNSASKTSSAVITIALDPTTGVLKVVHVAP